MMPLGALGVVGAFASGQFTVDGAAMTPQASGNLAFTQILFKPGLNLVAFTWAEVVVGHW
jgi:hypothetical protein